MKKSLVVVESPTKAKTISRFLGRGYQVKASMGHVRDLPKSKLGVDIDDGYKPTYINVRGMGGVIRELKAAAKDADTVLFATDPDREGEAISWHLAHLLGIDPASKCRIEFNEITKNAIREAIKNPRQIDIDYVNAQQA
ncbi:MAG: toprim domain-containing protein, partial [Bacillota bacterium]